MYEFGRIGDALDFEKQQIILLIVHRELYFWHWYNLLKKERASKPVPFSFAKIPIKKDIYRTFGSQHGYGLSDRNHEKHNILGMSEFWGLNVTSQMKAGVHTTRGLIHIQREARDSRRPFPSIQWYHVFWERNIKRGFLTLLWYQKDTTYVIHFVVLKKVPHMWYKNEHRGIKRYHMCGTFCRCE